MGEGGRFNPLLTAGTYHMSFLACRFTLYVRKALSCVTRQSRLMAIIILTAIDRVWSDTKLLTETIGLERYMYQSVNQGRKEEVNKWTEHHQIMAVWIA